MGSSAFSQTGLISVALPASLATIGDYAFYICRDLRNVSIPEGVINIGEEAFSVCNFAQVSIPGSVRAILPRAFSANPALFSVKISNGVANIGNYAFSGCTRLTNIVLPKSVVSVQSSAFAGCSNLEGVFFAGNAPTFGSYVFDHAFFATVYYLPGTAGWEWVSLNLDRPVVLWNPQMQPNDGSFGVRMNGFGFNIAGTLNIPLVIEASTNGAAGSWVSLNSYLLVNGLIYFSDPQWTNYPNRFYRIRSP